MIKLEEKHVLIEDLILNNQSFNPEKEKEQFEQLRNFLNKYQGKYIEYSYECEFYDLTFSAYETIVETEEQAKVRIVKKMAWEKENLQKRIETVNNYVKSLEEQLNSIE